MPSSGNTDLENVKIWLEAAAAGDVPTLDRLLNSGFDIDYKAPYSHGFEDRREEFRSTAPALVLATQYGQTEAVRFLLAHGADIDKKNEFPLSDDSALLSAASNGNVDIVKEFAARGAKSACQGSYGGTTHPLAECVKVSTGPIEADAFTAAHMEVVRVLLEHGYDPNVTDQNGTTALEWALRQPGGNMELFRALLDYGADLNFMRHLSSSPMNYAAGYYSMEFLESLLEQGGRMQNDAGEYTLLHHASRAGRLDTLRMLLERGCDAEASKSIGTTAMFGAKPGAIKLLVERGFNLEARSTVYKGMTPLLCAINGCRTKVIACLLDEGADIDASDDNGDTVLHQIGSLIHDTYLSYVNLLRYLISRGANVNATNHAGESPLHVMIAACEANLTLCRGSESKASLRKACPSSITEGVTILLEAGASVYSCDQTGRTALHVSVFQNNIEVIDVLVNAGANVVARRNDGSPPLLEAVMSTRQRPVEWPSVFTIHTLIEAGGDINATNLDGKTALHCLLEGADLVRIDGFGYRKTAMCLFSEGIDQSIRDSQGRTAKEFAETLDKQDWVELLTSSETSPSAAQALPP